MNWLTSLIDLFYPRLCVVCDNSLMNGESFFCSVCLADFPFSDIAFTPEVGVLSFFDLSVRPERFYSLFYYDKQSNYRHLVYAVKYHSKKDLGVCLGRMLGQKMRGCTDADCIVPVPLHKKRERQRGFNQAFQIALGIAEVLNIEIINDVVFRTRNNISQTGKSIEERRRNVEGIFSLQAPWRLEGRHVLIVDDVITTGATTHACLNTLAEVGNIRFSLACLAQTKS